MRTSLDDRVLDNPAWAALIGPHAHLAERHGHAVRYPPDVAPFAALATDHAGHGWSDLLRLAGAGSTVRVLGDPVAAPPDWEVTEVLPGVQLVGSTVEGRADPEAEPLGSADVPEMLDLVARTRPGPFLARTIHLGTYLGIRRDGRLVAMAGERMHPPGFTEISAVCSDPDHRGRGLATRLLLAVAAGIRARGETPFLHALATNATAIRLYRNLGFELRRDVVFQAVRAPHD